MQAVVLAAGEGTRMRPLTYTKPKVMLPIANKPILEHLLLELKKAGVDEVVLVVGYHDEKVRDHFGDGERLGVRISYVTQRRQLGTAHALKVAAHALEDSFLMLNGDIILRSADIRKFVSMAREGVLALGVRDVENPEDYGVVLVEDGRVVGIFEKVERPPTSLANVGIYSLTSEVLEAVERTELSPRGEYEITDSLRLLIEKGAFVRAVAVDYWLDVSYPWDLLDANEEVLRGTKGEVLGEVEDNVVLKGEVSIGEGTVVRSGSYIVGPVVIGRNCEIGPNCYIRPHTAIGDGCHVGSSVEIKNSIIMRNSKVPHHNYVGDSVIGENCNLGAGTKVANLRLNNASVRIPVKGRRVDTRRRKFGAIIGDNVKTGINVSINVGTLIGNNVRIGPGATVGGIIEPNSEIF
ncbi:MAG: bifunctional sugar-1-phosphate nucleotidylyltransferase/acetyltransferase [Candidatus Alkanophagales archaeon]